MISYNVFHCSFFLHPINTLVARSRVREDRSVFLSSRKLLVLVSSAPPNLTRSFNFARAFKRARDRPPLKIIIYIYVYFFYTQATRYSLVLLVIDTSFLSSFFSFSSSSSFSFSSHGPFHLDARGARTKKVYLSVLDFTRFLLSVFWKNCCRSYRLFPLLPPSIPYVELLKCTPFPFWRKERILRNI